MHGVVDFGSDRCRLDGDARLVFDGAATYTELEGGGWIRDAGTPGTRSMFHPRFALEALRRACTNVRAVSGEQFSVELDRSVLDRIVHAGVSPIWAVSAEVRLDQAGRVTNADLKLWDPSEPGEAMHLSYSLDGFAGPLTIDLPQVVET
jgi:hypothetical protein